MNKPPTGTVTFLFTDIVGSTEMWEQHGDAFLPVLQAHNAILADAIERYGGYLIKTEGDAYKVAFADPAAAAKCAILAQAALQRFPWPADVGALRVRMALHTGEPFMQADDYFGPPLNRTARILSTTHGDQILVSEETLILIESRMEEETGFTDLGHHTLRDLHASIRLFQIEHPAMQRRHFPPPRSLNGQAHNLPTERRSFIGREKEIEHIAAELASGETRLLTLTGPEGSGKTRLSVRVGAELAERFPDGVWFVPLTSAADAVGAAIEVADALGIPLPPGAPPMETVQGWLADRQCLLILDDCGYVPEAGRFIRELLSGTAALRCLATSRTPPEEGAHLALRGLSLPPENANAAEVMRSESGQLFVERAKEARPDFALTNRRAPAISRLLRKLEGLPGPVGKAAESLLDSKVTARTLDTLGKQLLQSAEEVTQVAASHGRNLWNRMRQSPGLNTLLHTLKDGSWAQTGLAEAERIYRDELFAYEQKGDKAGVAESLRQLGNIAFVQQDYRRAITLFGAAHQLFVELKRPESLDVRSDLEAAHKALGHQHDAALPLHQAIALAMGQD